MTRANFSGQDIFIVLQYMINNLLFFFLNKNVFKTMLYKMLFKLFY